MTERSEVVRKPVLDVVSEVTGVLICLALGALLISIGVHLFNRIVGHEELVGLMWLALPITMLGLVFARIGTDGVDELLKACSS